MKTEAEQTYDSNDTKQKVQYEKHAFWYLDCFHTVIAAGQAYQYDGKRYVQVPKLKINLRKWMVAKKIPQSNTLVDNVAGIIEGLTTTDKVLPCWHDGKKERLIPFQNGLLRLNTFLETGQAELMPHTPNYLSTWCVPCDFQPEAKCPRWLTFLNECLEGEEDQIRLCQEWFGYLLSGDTSHQKYMAHIGAKQSGKSTIARVLEQIFGTGATAYNLRQLAGRFGLGGLVGKSLALVGEVELAGCKERAEIIERMKGITGNDPQQIERKGDNVFLTQHLPARLHIISNSVPVLRDPTLALARRMLILWSPSSIPEEQKDTSLDDKLNEELPGILSWALEGCGRLHRTGRFTVTDRMKAELRAIERDASPLIAFVRDKCQVHKSFDGGTLPDVEWVEGPLFETPKSAIWEAAVKWEQESQISLPEEPVWFWRDLRAVLPRMSAQRTQRKIHNQYVDVVEGLRIKP